MKIIGLYFIFLLCSMVSGFTIWLLANFLPVGWAYFIVIFGCAYLTFIQVKTGSI